MESKRHIKPIRTVLRWQVIATAMLTLIAALLWGLEGAVSAALGGAINVVAGWVYGWRISRVEARTAGEALRTMLRAEAIKATFVITVGVFAAAIAVPDTEENNSPRPAGDS